MPLNITGSTTKSKTSGGTAGLLPRERAGASFDVAKLSKVLRPRGDADAAARSELFKGELFDFTDDVNLDRKEGVLKSAERSIEAMRALKRNPDVLKQHMDPHIGKGGPGFTMGSGAQSDSSAVGNHYAIFIGSLLARGSDEQKREWFNKAINMQILGAYAQTELGHGSNVRGLATTATYDKATGEFIIDSPNLGAAKAWPGCFGIFATHSIVYARLLIDGRDYGVHEFMVQLRDENHRPMPGVEVGDLGEKIGYNLVDNGYCMFHEVRIPRKNMLSKYSSVNEQGEYVKAGSLIRKDKGGASAKLGHIVMIQTRVGMVSGAGHTLAKAATIAVRYSAVREQGFKDTRTKGAMAENQVIEYQMQRYRLFKGLCNAYAFTFAAVGVRAQLQDFFAALRNGDVTSLAELHASAAGLKGMCTNLCGDMIEDLRRCCGGHGCTNHSGIGKLVGNYNCIAPIAEGDQIVLMLQTARFLVRAQQSVNKGATSVEGQAAYLAHPARFAGVDPKSIPSLRDAFAWRAVNSVKVATASFEARLASGMEFDKAWNSSAVDLVTAARHHCHLLILESFARVVNNTEDSAVRAALARLCRLYALYHIREQGADWADANISGRDIRACSEELFNLLDEIRPDAVAMVDAFQFSDNELQSSIGRFDGNVYEAIMYYAKKSPLNDEDFVQRLHKEQLSKCLNLDYIKAQAKLQRSTATAKL